MYIFLLIYSSYHCDGYFLLLILFISGIPLQIRSFLLVYCKTLGMCSALTQSIRVCQNYGYLFGDPYNKDCSILGSRLESPYLGKLPTVHPAQV